MAKTARDEEASERRNRRTKTERLLMIGIAADIANLAQAVKDEGRPASLRQMADALGVSHGTIDKYLQARSQIPLTTYFKLMKYLFDRLPASARTEHASGQILTDPSIADMVNGGLSDETNLSSVLLTQKAMADVGVIPADSKAVLLHDYLVRVGERYAPKFP